MADGTKSLKQVAIEAMQGHILVMLGARYKLPTAEYKRLTWPTIRQDLKVNGIPDELMGAEATREHFGAAVDLLLADAQFVGIGATVRSRGFKPAETVDSKRDWWICNASKAERYAGKDRAQAIRMSVEEAITSMLEEGYKMPTGKDVENYLANVARKA